MAGSLPEPAIYPGGAHGFTVFRRARALGLGFVYLVVIMDWVSRAVLAWRLSNTLDADFCDEAVEEALSRYGRPEIFNTDQAASSPVTTSPAP